jgi:hypothetical protein
MILKLFNDDFKQNRRSDFFCALVAPEKTGSSELAEEFICSQTRSRRLTRAEVR